MTETTQAASASSEIPSSSLRAPWSPGIIRAAAGAVLVVAMVSWLGFLWRALHAPVGQYDFSSYYAAATAIRHDLHADIYSPAVLAAAGAQGHVQVQPPLPYTYPPLAALLFSPFTLVSFRVASRLWLFVNAALCLAAVALFASEIAFAASASVTARARDLRAWVREPLRLVALAIAAAITLSSAPVRQTILTGQIDLLVLLPLTVVPWLLRERRDTWAGAAVALAAMLKLTPGLLLLYFILRGRWKALWSAVATLVGLSLASMLVVGPSVFFASIPQALRVGAGDATLGHNEAMLAAISTIIATAWPAASALVHVATYVLLAVLALALGWVIWRSGRETSEPSVVDRASTDVLAYGVAVCGLLLLAPTAWVHHYVWVLPAFAVAFGALLGTLRGPSGRTRRWIALVMALVIGAVLVDLLLPHAWDTEPHPAITTYFGLPIRPILLEARAVGTLLVAAVLSLLVLRLRPASPVRTEAI